jgi:succinoglycan biosynthesis transport protein ExoP
MTTDKFQQPLENIRGYARILTRHWWQILIGACLCLVVFTVTIARMPNEFEATTTILVDPQQVPEKYVSAAVNSDPGDRLSTITQQVLSRTRLQDIIDKVGLYAELKRTVPEEELVQQMRDHIHIQVKQGSAAQLSTFTITFQGGKPTMVAAVANELASSFIRWNIDNREQQVEGTQAFLSAELQRAKGNLEEQEDKLRVFKMSHLGETPDQTTSNLEAVTTLRAALQGNIDNSNRLEQERLLLTRLPQSVVPNGAPEVTLTRRGRLEAEKRQVEGDLRRLRETYSDKYPDVIKSERRLQEVTAELNSVPEDSVSDNSGSTSDASTTSVRLELIDKDLKRLKIEQSRIQAQMSAYQAKADAAPLREQQLVELNRNYDVSKQHYQALLDKSFNIEMAVSLEQKQKGERFTVLDPAQVPERPVKPRRKMLLCVALLVSLVLPCFVVVGKEMLNSTIKTDIELKSLIPKRVRIIGRIPRIEAVADRRRSLRVGSFAVVASILLCAYSAWLVWQMRSLL